MGIGRARRLAVRVRDPEMVEDQPAQETMRAGARAASPDGTLRSPSTDQLKTRRQMGRGQAPATRTASRGDISMSDQHFEAGLLQAMAAAPSRQEQRAIGARLAAFRKERADAARETQELDFSIRAVAAARPIETFIPTRSTAASDWLDDVEPDAHDLDAIAQQMTASASVWYPRVAEAVRADPQELAIQAQGMAAREASRFGGRAPEAARAFLDHVGHLHGRRLVAEQVPSGSALPPAVDNEQTFDQSLWGPAGPADRETGAGDTPSLAEGDAPEGDQPQATDNPAAWAPHDAGPAGPQPLTDYLDGSQTAPQYGTGMQSMNSLLGRGARRVLAEGEQAGVLDEAHPSSADQTYTPSQQEGQPPQGDVPMTMQPPVELAPHDAGPGNGPATDYLDGTQYAFATLRPLAVVARTIPRTALAEMPAEALQFVSALLRLRTAADSLGTIPGQQIVEALIRTAGPALPPAVAAELRAHLEARTAGDLPPWLKDKDDDESKDDDSEDSKDDEGDDKSDEDDDSDKDDEDEDEDDDKPAFLKGSALSVEPGGATAAFRARVQAGPARHEG